MAISVTTTNDTSGRTTTIHQNQRETTIHAAAADHSGKWDKIPASVSIRADNARTIFPEDIQELESHDQRAREGRRAARSGEVNLNGYQTRTEIKGNAATRMAKGMGLSKEAVAAISEIHLTADGKHVQFNFKDGTTAQTIQSATDQIVHKAADAKVVPPESIPELARRGAITQEPITVGTNSNTNRSTRIDIPRTATTTGSGVTLYVDSATGKVNVGLGDKTGASLTDNERNTLRHVAKAAGVPEDAISAQLNPRNHDIVHFDTDKNLGQMRTALTENRLVGAHNLSELEGAVKQYGVKPVKEPAPHEHHGAGGGKADIAKSGVFKMLGPIPQMASEALGVTATTKEADARLRTVAKENGITFSAQAIEEYKGLSIAAKMEQSASFGMSEQIGFNKFIEWGSKHSVPVDAMIKLNPTHASPETIRASMALNAPRTASLGDDMQQALQQARDMNVAALQLPVIESGAPEGRVAGARPSSPEMGRLA